MAAPSIWSTRKKFRPSLMRYPSPSSAPMNSEMTMTKNESATPRRIPVRSSGSAAGSTTRKKSGVRRAPRLAGAGSSSGSTPPNAGPLGGNIGKNNAEGMNAIFHPPPIPTPTVQSGRMANRRSGAPWSPHSTRSVTVFTNMTSSRRAHGVTASAAAVWWTYLTRGAAGQDGAEALYCAAMGDLLLRRGVVDGRRRDVAIRDGRIRRLGVDLDPTGYDALDVTDKLVLPGFVESHIHPDKAFIADRTEGLRAGGPSAQTLVAELKKTFTVDDIYRRARRVMELAVRHGCTTMRAHVEVDAYVELRGA